MAQTRNRRVTRGSSATKDEPEETPEVAEQIDTREHQEVEEAGEAVEEAKVTDDDPPMEGGDAPTEPAVEEKADQDTTGNYDVLLPVMDTTTTTAEEKQTAPSSEEEGAVPGEAEASERPPKRPRNVTQDDDDDDLIKIEKDLDGDRYSGIDAGTKKRLAVILDYARMKPDSLEEKVLDQLKRLSKPDATEAMKMLDHSVRTSKIRNLSAYLSSMIRRMTSKTARDTERAPHGTLQDVAPEAREILQDLIDSRLVRQEDLDGKALSILAEKPRDVQTLIVELFSNRNLASVRNMAAYFMAHMREVDTGLRSGKYRIGKKHEERRHPERREYGSSRHEEKPHYDYVPTSLRQSATYPTAQHIQEGVLPPIFTPSITPAQEAPAKHYALEQVQWGVRVDEFQALSPHAKYVHAAAALRLQQLWDVEQNKLVSVLDDNSWLLLAGLDAPNGVKVVNEVSERMKTVGDDLTTVNRIFVEVASKYPRREDAPPLPTSMSYQPQALTASLLSSVQGTTYTNPVYDPRGSAYSQPQVSLPGPAGSLPPRIQSKIDEILGNPNWIGKFSLDSFDERLVDMLHRDEQKAYQVLDEFNRSNPGKVRNPSAYLVGCVRNAFAATRPGPERGPRGRGGRFGSGGRGRGPPPRYNPY